MAQVFDHAGQDRNHNNGDNGKREVVFYKGNIAEIITGKKEQANPGYSGRDIVKGEAPMSHGAYAGDKRGEGPDNRHESGYDYRFPPVFFEKAMRPVKIFPVEETDILLVENLRSDAIPNPVIYGVSPYCGKAKQAEEPFNLQGPDGGKCSCGEEEGIARKDGCHDEAGFTENDQKKNHIRPGAVILYNDAEVYVQMQKNIY